MERSLTALSIETRFWVFRHVKEPTLRRRFSTCPRGTKVTSLFNVKDTRESNSGLLSMNNIAHAIFDNLNPVGKVRSDVKCKVMFRANVFYHPSLNFMILLR